MLAQYIEGNSMWTLKSTLLVRQASFLFVNCSLKTLKLTAFSTTWKGPNMLLQNAEFERSYIVRLILDITFHLRSQKWQVSSASLTLHLTEYIVSIGDGENRATTDTFARIKESQVQFGSNLWFLHPVYILLIIWVPGTIILVVYKTILVLNTSKY